MVGDFDGLDWIEFFREFEVRMIGPFESFCLAGVELWLFSEQDMLELVFDLFFLDFLLVIEEYEVFFQAPFFGRS